MIFRSMKTEAARNLPLMLPAQMVVFLKDVKGKVLDVEATVMVGVVVVVVVVAAMAGSPEVADRTIAPVDEEEEMITRKS